MKICKLCQLELPKSEFYKNSTSKDRLGYLCINCTKKDSARRYQENRESRLEGMRIAYHKEPEKFRTRKVEAGKQPHIKMSRANAVKAWQSKNKDRVVAYAAKRRAVKLGATTNWIPELDELAFLEAASLAKMRELSTHTKWEVDHIVPLQSQHVCGLHCFSNIAVVPMAVNRSKSNRHWPGI